ncbi:MAG TPA: tRNA uridine-5-carboxymethylaminomethyl(34) synthesis GTPase MnmE [Candidatus Limiplasma sp.]|nr:tRNA uridine-5-carboxymethylaminomethyl(34) synthesis GTPase MnmE [Candidatus Limiplasma sp.]HRX09114.1 tRNA uridine-5-carboxymethylaminomethyl(34) synthesis GTPase MnmE [Candidatus Limiplasma sp.]
MSDTIAGVATAPGEGGIAIVRISGENAIVLFTSVFHASGRRPPFPDHLLMHGIVVDQNNDTVDEAMGVVMAAPHSYTAEDVCELHVHGGHAAASIVMKLLIEQGARPAEPGEFTRRAFMNGRIDLAQAEAVMGIIGARSAAALKSQEALLSGGASRFIAEAQNELIKLIAGVEAYIDYPEEIGEDEATASLLCGLETLAGKLRSAANERASRILRSGLRVALYGSPNTGKSTLFNALLAEDRAIVTHIPGTTRDVLEGSFTLNGLQVFLLDTAGLRNSSDAVEIIGVQRARQVIDNADVALLLIDATKPLDEAEHELLSMKLRCPSAVLLNKEDQPPVLTVEYIKAEKHVPVFSISAKNGIGLSQVLTYLSQFLTQPREDMLTHQRHIALAQQAAAKLTLAIEALRDGTQLDLIAVDLREALWLLGRITGDSVDDKLLDEIFSSFCVGK